MDSKKRKEEFTAWPDRLNSCIFRPALTDFKPRPTHVGASANPQFFASEAAFLPGTGRRRRMEALKRAEPRGGALLSSVTTLLSFSTSFVGQNGASGSKSGIGPSGTS